MPTYEYGCQACSHEWEEMQRITAPPTEVCPKCGKSQAHRLISGGTNFILKGGGWYSDLYSSAKGGAKKEDAKGTTSTDSKPAGEAAAKTETKAETKSETKTDSKAPPAASTTPSGSST